MFRRFGQFAGGIDLPEEKHNTLDAAVAAIDLPENLYLNVSELCLGTADIIVSPGQRVSAGAILATSTDRNGINLYAPVDCTIERISNNETIVLSELGEWKKPVHEPRHMIWQAFDKKRMRKEIVESDIAITRKPAESLKQWLRRSIDFKCSHLILNAMETQPCVTSEHRTLAEFGQEAVQGLVMLAKAGTFKRMTIAVDNDRVDSYCSILDMLNEYNIEHVALPRKYPLGEDAMLLKVLRRREIPPGKRPCDIGVAVIDPYTCMNVYRLVVCEQRLCGKIVTVAGDRLSTFHNYFVPYGMRVSDVTKHVSPPIIKGGIMNGKLCGPDDTVDYKTNALLAIDLQPHANATQCIRCGWCTDHCPARLNVSALNDTFEMSQINHAKKLGVIACVDCGICSYVCPARLPLHKRIRRLYKAVKSINSAMPLFNTTQRSGEDE